MDQICIKGKCRLACDATNFCQKRGQKCLKIKPKAIVAEGICLDNDDCNAGYICTKSKCQKRCDTVDNPYEYSYEYNY